jgi:hypothetical protein
MTQSTLTRLVNSAFRGSTLAMRHCVNQPGITDGDEAGGERTGTMNSF